jgi:hypothetical protein
MRLTFAGALLCVSGTGESQCYNSFNMAKDDKPVIINIKNRRASHEYSFLAKYDAGVM